MRFALIRACLLGRGRYLYIFPFRSLSELLSDYLGPVIGRPFHIPFIERQLFSVFWWIFVICLTYWTNLICLNVPSQLEFCSLGLWRHRVVGVFAYVVYLLDTFRHGQCLSRIPLALSMLVLPL